MFCPYCGSEVNDGSVFCDNCGKKINDNSSNVDEGSILINPENERKKGKTKIILGIIISIVLAIGALLIIGAVVDKREKNSYIEMVRGGCPSGYPTITYGNAFEAFFENPKWSYFKSTDEQDIVEFSGNCTYSGAEVTATLQFMLDAKEGTFEMGAFDINGVPQNQLITFAVIAKAFDEYGNSDENNNSEQIETEDVQATTIVDEQNNYDKLESFISCINEYTDAPELEGEELENYYKEQYDSWRNGTDYNNISIDENGNFYNMDDMEEGIDYNSAYGDILLDVGASYGDESEYALFDLNNDGFKELITSQGTCDADWTNDVYTIEDGYATMLGQFYGTVMLYASEDGNGLYAVSGSMGYQHIDWVKISNGSLQVDNIVDEELGESEDYYSNSNPVSMIAVNDDSLLHQ